MPGQEAPPRAPVAPTGAPFAMHSELSSYALCAHAEHDIVARSYGEIATCRPDERKDAQRCMPAAAQSHGPSATLWRTRGSRSLQSRPPTWARRRCAVTAGNVAR